MQYHQYGPLNKNYGKDEQRPQANHHHVFYMIWTSYSLSLVSGFSRFKMPSQTHFFNQTFFD